MKPSDFAMSANFALLVIVGHFNAESMMMHIEFLAWLLARNGH